MNGSIEPLHDITRVFREDRLSRARRRNRDRARPRRLRPLAPSLLVLAFVLAGCDQVEPDTSTNRPMPAALPPKALRVVSLSPSATRFVVALGAGPTLIGVDAGSAERLAPASPPVVAVGERDGAAGLEHLSPDLVIVPRELESRVSALASSGGFELVVFEAHDLEDVLALCQSLGVRLVGAAGAATYERRLSRPLARIGGEAFGRARLDVVAVLELDPPWLAGGHSFATDLIEIAGSQSVTHAGGLPRLSADAETLAALGPDVVVVMRPEPVSDERLERLRRELRIDVPLIALEVDFDTVYEGGLEERVVALRSAIARAHRGEPVDAGSARPGDG